MDFALLFIPTGHVFRINDNRGFTNAPSKEIFEREAAYLFENYLKLPYVNEEIEKDTITFVRYTLASKVNLVYEEKEFSELEEVDGVPIKKTHWVFPFIDFIKKENARWCGGIDVPDSIADASWPNLTFSEFEIIEYD
ncbi:MAG: hypothetical protein JHC33_01980 [Ignisphaera sp.]|nr:hypothetical protein [Ignisphaera sp.]